MTSTPEKVFTDATEALDERQDHAVLPARHRINPNVTGQPLEGSGYVYAQVGWLDEHGSAYGLRLPDTMDRAGTGLRPLYICLGRHGKTADVYIPGMAAVRPEDAEPCA